MTAAGSHPITSTLGSLVRRCSSRKKLQPPRSLNVRSVPQDIEFGEALHHLERASTHDRIRQWVQQHELGDRTVAVWREEVDEALVEGLATEQQQPAAAVVLAVAELTQLLETSSG